MYFSFQIPKGLAIPHLTFCNHQPLSITSMLKLAEIQTYTDTDTYDIPVETDHDQMVQSYDDLLNSLFTLKEELITYQENQEEENITGPWDNTSQLYEWSTLANDLTKRATIATLLNNYHSWADPSDLGPLIEEILIDCSNAGRSCNTDDYIEK